MTDDFVLFMSEYILMAIAIRNELENRTEISRLASRPNLRGQDDVKITAILVTVGARLLSSDSVRRRGDDSKTINKERYFGKQFVAGMLGDRIQHV